MVKGKGEPCPLISGNDLFGYIIIWALRASSLLVALFSMMPLWRGVDPLPVLADVEKRKKALAGIEDDKEEEDKKAGEVGYLFDRAVDKPQQKGSKGKKV